MAHIFVGLAMGIVFGFALEKSRVFEPGALVRQFQLRNFLMVKVFFTAIATSMLSITILKLTVADFAFDLTPFNLPANAIGGTLLGIGVALTGACPGTVLAQVGSGYRDALFTLFGGLIGAALFTTLKAPLIDPIFFSRGCTPVTFPELLGVPFEMLALGSAVAIAALLILLEKRTSWRSDVGAQFDAIN